MAKTTKDFRDSIYWLHHSLGHFPSMLELEQEWEMPASMVQLTLNLFARQNLIAPDGDWYRLSGAISGADLPEVPAETFEWVDPKNMTAEPFLVSHLPLELRTKEQVVQSEHHLPGYTAKTEVSYGGGNTTMSYEAKKGIPDVQSSRSVSEGTGTPKDWPLISVKIAMGCIAAGAVILSGYYTFIWALTFLDGPLAFLLASTIVLFSVFGFEAILICWSNGQRMAALGLLCCGMVALGYSFTSTVGGQYNAWLRTQANEQAQKAPDKKFQVELTNLKKILKLDEDELMARTTRRDGLQTLANSYGDAQTRNDLGATWYRTQDDLKTAQTDVTKQVDIVKSDNAVITKLQIEHPEAEAETTEIPDAFGWLATTFQASREFAQFVVTLFPAVFMDVIAPVALAVALFLQRRTTSRKSALIVRLLWVLRRLLTKKKKSP